MVGTKSRAQAEGEMEGGWSVEREEVVVVAEAVM